MKYEWRPIIGYDGFYEVSDTGMVRSVDRYINLSDRRKRRIKGKVLKHKRNADNYLFVSLSKDGVARTCYVHRLVATAFIPNPGDLPEVNHRSGQKEDNSIGNLAWVTHKQNVQHAYDNRLTSNMGASHSFAVGVIDNELGMTFDTIREWCNARGIKYSTGRNLMNGSNKSKTIDLSGVVKITKTND